MEQFVIDVIVPTGPGLARYICSEDREPLYAQGLQEAVDIAFAREIDRDEEYLRDAMMNSWIHKDVYGRQHFVIKRKEIEINLRGNYLHPSRLTDSQVKEMLRLDAQYHDRQIDESSLEKRVFLI